MKLLNTLSIEGACQLDQRYYVEGLDYNPESNQLLISTGPKGASTLNLMQISNLNESNCEIKSTQKNSLPSEYFGEGTAFSKFSN